MNDCSCANSIKTNVNAARAEAVAVEIRYVRSLDAFRDAIIEGAIERIARTLFKAGVYTTCLHYGLRRDFDADLAVRTLEKNLAPDPINREIYTFLTSNIRRVELQASSINISELLKPLLKKGRAEGLLTASYDREIQQAIAAYKRAERLKQQLEAWKANAKLQDKIQYSKILDVHDVSK